MKNTIAERACSLSEKFKARRFSRLRRNLENQGENLKTEWKACFLVSRFGVLSPHNALIKPAATIFVTIGTELTAAALWVAPPSDDAFTLF
jgi:hypothetical protein